MSSCVLCHSHRGQCTFLWHFFVALFWWHSVPPLLCVLEGPGTAMVRSSTRSNVQKSTTIGMLVGVFVLYLVVRQYPLWAVALLSVGSFVCLFYDKQQSRTGGYRVSESILLLINLLGGWPGGLLGVVLLRHKRQKASFLLMLVCSICVHLLLLHKMGFY
jgi:uncharacterized membrane protein YsdA (DUF1294 family)